MAKTKPVQEQAEGAAAGESESGADPTSKPEVAGVERNHGVDASSSTQSLPYRVGEWNGHMSYHCRTCPLGTLDKDEIERHVCRPAVATQEG
jgi:hypothetical protein